MGIVKIVRKFPIWTSHSFSQLTPPSSSPSESICFCFQTTFDFTPTGGASLASVEQQKIGVDRRSEWEIVVWASISLFEIKSIVERVFWRSFDFSLFFRILAVAATSHFILVLFSLHLTALISQQSELHNVSIWRKAKMEIKKYFQSLTHSFDLSHVSQLPEASVFDKRFEWFFLLFLQLELSLPALLPHFHTSLHSLSWGIFVFWLVKYFTPFFLLSQISWFGLCARAKRMRGKMCVRKRERNESFLEHKKNLNLSTRVSCCWIASWLNALALFSFVSNFSNQIMWLFPRVYWVVNFHGSNSTLWNNNRQLMDWCGCADEKILQINLCRDRRKRGEMK